ncbi:hypothetical protein Dda_7022 [Drechslerella dactyloides]|uniref:Uncharacterized protein n=1 Tax=Drechslerella dactyloides TaxID=74499 RepID=A0AAD6ITK4_DREDA|nr:hypothetical protein Dda_7022 [Drechslerella dactyloides]
MDRFKPDYHKALSAFTSTCFDTDDIQKGRDPVEYLQNMVMNSKACGMTDPYHQLTMVWKGFDTELKREVLRPVPGLTIDQKQHRDSSSRFKKEAKAHLEDSKSKHRKYGPKKYKKPRGKWVSYKKRSFYPKYTKEYKDKVFKKKWENKPPRDKSCFIYKDLDH